MPQILMCENFKAQSSCILIQTFPLLKKPTDGLSSGNTVVDNTCAMEYITDKLSGDIKATDFFRVSYHNHMVIQPRLNISSCIAF